MEWDLTSVTVPGRGGIPSSNESYPPYRFGDEGTASMSNATNSWNFRGGNLPVSAEQLRADQGGANPPPDPRVPVRIPNPVLPPPQVPLQVIDTKPYLWGATKFTSSIPLPGWFRQQPGVIGGSSMNPYTTTQEPIATEAAFRTTPSNQWAH